VQTLKPLEIILIDDGSTDDLMMSVSTWLLENDIPFNMVKQENRGAPSARNAGLVLAKGKYIAFLDADDAWLPNKLEMQRALMESYELTLCGHGYFPDSTNLKYQKLLHSHDNVKLKKSPSI
jgi:glycosyltransferase involved in cell wall biosynthesis